MSDSVVDLSARIVAHARKIGGSGPVHILAPESLAKLYSCTAQLIGPQAEEVLWDRVLAHTPREAAEDCLGHHGVDLRPRPREGNGPNGTLTVSAERFVATYILNLSALVGHKLTIRHSENCFPQNG